MAEYRCDTCSRTCKPDGLFKPERVAYRCTECRKIICSDCANGIILKDCPLCDTSLEKFGW